MLDIAWFIYAHRLSLAGYPFARLHPRVDAFLQKLRARPEFGKEVAMPPELEGHLAATRKGKRRPAKPWRWWRGYSREVGKQSGEGLDHGSGHGGQGLAHRKGILSPVPIRSMLLRR